MKRVGVIMQWAGMALMASALICGATGVVDLIIAVGMAVVAWPVVLFGCIMEAEGK